MMKVSGKVVLLALGMMMAFVGTVSAHVVVYPKQVTQGAYEKFVVRVPTEKDVPTVNVQVAIPEGAEISRFEPKAGWTYEIERDANDKIVKVTWSATDAGLSATEFADFGMQGKVAADAEQLIWRAYQTYEDGTVVEWTGAAGSDTPASITSVLMQKAGDDQATETSESSNSIAWISLVISIIALLLAGATLLRKRH